MVITASETHPESDQRGNRADPGDCTKRPAGQVRKFVRHNCVAL
jgi:hypothetical protein